MHDQVPIIGEQKYELGTQTLGFGTLSSSGAAKLLSDHIARGGQMDIAFALLWMCASEQAAALAKMVEELAGRVSALETRSEPTGSTPQAQVEICTAVEASVTPTAAVAPTAQDDDEPLGSGVVG